MIIPGRVIILAYAFYVSNGELHLSVTVGDVANPS